MKTKEILCILIDMFKMQTMGQSAPIYFDGQQYQIDGLILSSNQVRTRDGDDLRFKQIGDIDKDQLPLGIGTGVQVYDPEDDTHDPMEWKVTGFSRFEGQWAYDIERPGVFPEESNLETLRIKGEHLRPFNEEEVIKQLTGRLKLFDTRSRVEHYGPEYKDENGKWHTFPDFGEGKDQILFNRLAELIY